ncbi:succinate-semialdehyde dehydrogenase/glutarate-semialdehyde dehydrogenase [Leucobacter luti]|uniref:aldehyde dehydrogenase family protein n=1 Tax=Leucobacter luti TaxID=340320 RepID=UPI00104E3D64|nr:aldehyde dehydrogenase family protein [Leucobacter luti]MCW2288128.1 acyl-CoA reductase-like NAD-dependent aldehyde dehydrogenase [Leucobacter luti]TCK45710.1 succinate-semialdehyde dehydrogenase/glutarate-semialdehyde dehydrogenase [Leucobacter luti]
MASYDRTLCVGGEWVPALSGETIEVRDPATGEVIGTSSVAGAADVDRAVVAAQEGFRRWNLLTADERCDILLRAAAIIDERTPAMAELLTREQGKPIPDSVKEISFGAQVIRYYAEQGRRVWGSMRPTSRADIRSLVTWEPLGVVAAIVPWNYPVDLYAWKIGPALAAGNSVVVKPPTEAPLAIAEFVQCFLDAGIPEGVLSDLPGAFAAGSRLSEHPDVAAITATASTATGQAIMRSAASTMKRVTLELGGHSPFIVLDDADIAEAATAAARRSFSNAGQICIAVNRILVAEAIADEFAEAVITEARAITLGHGVEAGITGGPVTTAAVIEKSRRHISEALASGAVLGTGGKNAEVRDGLDATMFFEPTVLDRVSADALVMHEETFGPLVAVHRFAAGTDVAELANRGDYGLAAYVYGNDLDRAWGVAERIHAGGVGVNINDVSELQAPFGGWKMSGFGRELGPEGLQGMMQQRHIRLRRRHA